MDENKIENMSPAELRAKLAEFGLPVMPITQSTRGVLVKKLKLLMSAQNSGARSLAKYSSGEESDLDAGEKPKRRSMPPPSPAVRPRRTTPVHHQPPAKAPTPEPPMPHVSKVTTRRTNSRTTIHTNDEYETGSDSEVDAAPSPTSASLRNPIKNSIIPSSTSVSYSTTDITENLNSIRSRLGLIQPSERNYSPPASPPVEPLESPYLNSFAKKLSALKAEAKSPLLNSERSNGSDSYLRTRYTPYERRRVFSPDLKTAGEKNVSKNNLVSLAIVGVGVFFFVAVTFVYMGMKTQVSFDPNDANNTIPICIQNAPNHKSTENCVLQSKVNSAMDLLKILYPELTSRAIEAKCSNNKRSPYMTQDETIKFIESVYGSGKIEDLILDFKNAQVLIINNPKWGMSVMRLQSDENDSDTVLNSMDYVVMARTKSRVALAILNPSISVTCLVKEKLYYFLTTVFIAVFIFLFLYSLKRGINAYRDYRKNKQDQIYRMVEQIIEFLSQDNGEETTDGMSQAIPVNHIRDMLIMPQNREKMSKYWNDAIKFLEENESRARFEVNVINGEDYKSVRWLSPQGSPRALRGGARSWQGQAFETQRGSVNNLSVSPTPCLKIRHMVDKNDKNPNLRSIIQDAILEKCGPECRILHVEIDKVSCCVFVKCATPEDAGIVYQNLHGWWYEGSLITVKYLRLERYMDHFPQSPSVGPYLKLSTQSK